MYFSKPPSPALRFLIKRPFLALPLIALLGLAGCTSQVNETPSHQQLLSQADALYENKQYTDAKKIYLGIVNPEQFLPVTYYRLGNIFFAEKNFIQSQHYYLESLKQKPQSIKTHYNIANVYLRLAEFHLIFFQENTKSKELSQKSQKLLESIEEFTHNKPRGK